MLIPGRARALVFAVLAIVAAGCPNGAGITCPNGQTLCNGRCIYVASDPQNCGGCGNVCPGSLVCIAGSCGCPQGQLACANVCIDPNVDPNNCGDCGVACVAGQLCSAGQCATTCGVNLTQCGKLCIDTQNDPMNCGMCGHACNTGEICCSGGCTITGVFEHCQGCTSCMPGDFCYSPGGDMGNQCTAG